MAEGRFLLGLGSCHGVGSRIMSDVEREGRESQVERERSLELQRPGERQTGIVKEFDDVKGFGFITPDEGGRDAFVHFAAVLVAGRRTLSAGQRVSYRIQEDATGRPEAMAVIPEVGD